MSFRVGSGLVGAASGGQNCHVRADSRLDLGREPHGSRRRHQRRGQQGQGVLRGEQGEGRGAAAQRAGRGDQRHRSGRRGGPRQEGRPRRCGADRRRARQPGQAGRHRVTRSAQH
ncbi:hypothetical protein MICRO8M_50050 [Microbacterium sp. 8M]|nr:hypothetical protein MICRO8M_50050 [Microbacterium sp. 8M]